MRRELRFQLVYSSLECGLVFPWAEVSVCHVTSRWREGEALVLTMPPLLAVFAFSYSVMKIFYRSRMVYHRHILSFAVYIFRKHWRRSFSWVANL
jgi:hypothetical protein